MEMLTLSFKNDNILSSLFIIMYNEESASLILRTSDLTANSTNSVGTSNLYYTNMTWENINLRTLLGNMYDKYDRFAFVPVSFQSNMGDATFGSTNDDRIVSVNISGLPFTNNNYSSSSKTNQINSVIYVTRFLSSSSINSSTGGTILTFTKNQELVNLNISYQRTSLNGNGNYNIITTAAFPHVIFTFNIYGISKTDRIGDMNSSRIFEK